MLRPASLEEWARDLNDLSLLEQYPPGHDYIWTEGKLTRVSDLAAQSERVVESRDTAVSRKLTPEDKRVIRLGQGTLLEKEGDFYLACRGGRGGLGNAHFASSTNRSPETVTRGQLGETKRWASNCSADRALTPVNSQLRRRVESHRRCRADRIS